MVLVEWNVFSNGLEYVRPLMSTHIFYPPDRLLHWLHLSVSVKAVDSLQGLLHLPALHGLHDSSLEVLSCEFIPLHQSGIAVSLSSQQVGFLVVHEWNPNQSLMYQFLQEE